MKILVVADEEEASLWDYWTKDKTKDVDLILSAGDLKAEYLSFLVTMVGKPVFYVCGNHDSSYEKRPPEGCDCIDGKIISYNGVRILGLGGSMYYSGGPYQYSEEKMRARIRRLFFKLRKSGGVDILLTHAPVCGYGDGEDLPHRGFECFISLIKKYHPKYLVHGHVHKSYGHDFQRCRKIGDTEVVNASGHYFIEL